MESMRESRLRIGILLAVFLLGLSGPLMAEVTSLSPRTTGWFQTNFKYMVDGAASEAVKIPIPFYVIRHSEGVVLFDSGLGTRYREQVRSSWLNRLNQLVLPALFQRSQAAVEQVRTMGIRPEEVRFIVVSHLHFDHAGGLQDFPNATVVLSRGEWENSQVGEFRARLRGLMKEQFVGVDRRLWLIDYQPGTALKPFDASFDLLGDRSLLLLMTPGHTPGHQSLLVTLGSGQRILLTGDSVWTAENYTQPAPKSWFVRTLEENAEETWETTLKIHDFHQQHPEILIIPGHDPHLWGRLPKEFQ